LIENLVVGSVTAHRSRDGIRVGLAVRVGGVAILAVVDAEEPVESVLASVRRGSASYLRAVHSLLDVFFSCQSRRTYGVLSVSNRCRSLDVDSVAVLDTLIRNRSEEILFCQKGLDRFQDGFARAILVLAEAVGLAFGGPEVTLY